MFYEESIAFNLLDFKDTHIEFWRVHWHWLETRGFCDYKKAPQGTNLKMWADVHSSPFSCCCCCQKPIKSKPKPESKCSMWKVLRESKQWYIMQLPVWLQNKVHWQTAYIVGHKVTFGLLLILSNVTVWLASGKHLDRNEDTKDSLHSCPQCAWDGESERC